MAPEGQPPAQPDRQPDKPKYYVAPSEYLRPMEDPDAPKEPGLPSKALSFLVLPVFTGYLLGSLVISALFGLLFFFSASTLEMICYGIPLLIVAMLSGAAIYFRRLAKSREDGMKAEIQLRMEMDDQHGGT